MDCRNGLRTFHATGEARDRATQAALAAQNTRLDVMNEFRASLKDAQSSFATRVDLDALKEASRTFITRGEVYALCVPQSRSAEYSAPFLGISSGNKVKR